MMNRNQRFISILSQILIDEGHTMTYSQLRARMLERNLRPGATNLALGHQIGTAYHRAVEEGNRGVANCIAMAFTADDGSYYWDR